MDGADFEDLLTGEDLGATVRWQPSLPCPCVIESGAADQRCKVCFGMGRFYDEYSEPFRCGLIAQSARNRAALAQMMGPGMVGESVLVVPMSALCYSDLTEGDRVFDQMVHDAQQIVLQPEETRRLPLGFTKLRAYVKADDGLSLVEVAAPIPDASRRVSVLRTSTLVYRAPRGYLVLKELSLSRSFGRGLPKRWSLSLVDMSVR